MKAAALAFALLDIVLLAQLVLILRCLGQPTFFGRIHSLRGKQGENPHHPRCPQTWP